MTQNLICMTHFIIIQQNNKEYFQNSRLFFGFFFDFVTFCDIIKQSEVKNMSLFKRKKPEEKLSFKINMAEKMVRNRLRYATERDGDTDSVIGKNGGFNIRNGQLIVSADNHVIFRCNIEEMTVSELMSLEGKRLRPSWRETSTKPRSSSLPRVVTSSPISRIPPP